MHVSHLSLADYRSYAQAEVSLEPGISVFVGPNGQGKTNLVEAVGYLANLTSHRIAGDAPLVRVGAERAYLRAAVVKGERRQLIELEINPGRANRARINRSSQVRPRDILGILHTVVFAPEDLALVKGDPSERRRFLDELITARAPRMAGVRQDYDRVLKQRNALLKSAALARKGTGGKANLSTLDVWDQHLAMAGAELLAARLDLVAALHPLVGKAYEQLAPAGGATVLEYRSSMGEAATGAWTAGASGREQLAEALLAALTQARKQEVERGITLVGPHRDDLVLRLGEMPAKGYASHGESWSYALALRIAAYHLLCADSTDGAGPLGGVLDGARPAEAMGTVPVTRADEPVLILDDVFAELDTARRSRLAELVAPGEQVLVTAAVAADVPDLLTGARYGVRDSRILVEGTR